MPAPFRDSGTWRGRVPFVGRGPWAGKGPFGYNAGLAFAINATGTQIRAAISDPTAYGETLGPELVTNGGFVGVANGTVVTTLPGWVSYGTPVSAQIQSEALTVVTDAANEGAKLDFVAIVGRRYRVTFSQTGNPNLYIQNVSETISANQTTAVPSINVTATGTVVSVYWRPFDNVAGSYTIDNISVREVVTGYLLPGLGGARLNASARSSVAMQQKSDGSYEYAAHNLALQSEVNSLNTGGVSGATYPGGMQVAIADSGYWYKIFSAVPTSSTVTATFRISCSVSRTVCVRVANQTNGANQNNILATVGPTPAEFSATMTLTSGTAVEFGLDLRVTANAGVNTAAGTFTVDRVRLQYGPTALPYVPTTTAAVYAPAVDWLSAQSAYGLRSEAAATNLVLYSADLSNAAWTKNAAAATQDGPVSPFGIASSKLTASAAGGRAVQSVTSTSTSHTFWALLKRGNVSVYRLLVYNTTTAAVIGEIDFNLQTGVVATQTTATGAIAAVGTDGWYLCEVRVSSGITVGNAIVGYVYCGTGTILSGDIVYSGHAQMEAGLRASSPILTLGATATRAADTVDVVGSGINALAGSVVVDAVLSRATPSGIILVGLSATGSTILYFVDTDYRVYGSGGSFQTIPGAVPLLNVPQRAALAWETGSYSISAQGLLATNAESIGIVNAIRLGDYASGSSNQALGGHFTRIRYGQRRLSNAQLQALTV